MRWLRATLSPRRAQVAGWGPRPKATARPKQDAPMPLHLLHPAPGRGEDLRPAPGTPPLPPAARLQTAAAAAHLQSAGVRPPLRAGGGETRGCDFRFRAWGLGLRARF